MLEQPTTETMKWLERIALEQERSLDDVLALYNLIANQDPRVEVALCKQ
jgi:hypothetical protein